ncbi:MAG: hypothetical protein JWO09_3782 [Bacteroidetes bacterium]|nr:hypothetical protein [Bacteroidota bacterium]
MKRISIITLLSLIFSIGANSQTAVSGSIFSNTTWTISGSPYIVTGNVVLFSAATLTIDPGVVVKFDSAACLEVRGTLKAIGTVTDTIVFTSYLSSPSIGCWQGIKAIWTSAPSAAGHQVTMEYVKGMYAQQFINMDIAYNGPYTFKHCYFGHNNDVNYDGGSPSAVWEYCNFVSNNTGLSSCQFYGRVSKSVFIGNGIGVNGTEHVDSCLFTNNTIALQPYGSTIGCTIQNNVKGVVSDFNAVNNTFINNTVTNNGTGVEITRYFNGSINFTGNTICNNTGYNITRSGTFATNDADLSGNCWCSTDSAAIRAKIYDGYVNSAFGLVNFTPMAGSCPSISVGIDEAPSQSAMQAVVYPNPFTGQLRISVESTQEPAEVILYDLTSRRVMYESFTSSVILNTEQLAKGIYIYQVRTGNTVLKSGKVIKQ